MTAEEERQVCDALIGLGWLETEHGLHGEGVRAICGVLGCSSEDAVDVLHDVRLRKLVDIETGSGLGPRRLRWVRATG
jgi:hypothetical protein